MLIARRNRRPHATKLPTDERDAAADGIVAKCRNRAAKPGQARARLRAEAAVAGQVLVRIAAASPGAKSQKGQHHANQASLSRLCADVPTCCGQAMRPPNHFQNHHCKGATAEYCQLQHRLSL